MRQDGRSASLTAPNGRAQKLLLDAVITDAAMTPPDLPLLEAAANGSALGDAIEAGAIASAVLSVHRDSALLVNSTKANIGHTESASGMMGLTRLIGSLNHAQVPPNAQLTRLAQPVAIALLPKANAILPTNLATIADLQSGVASSFGLGGTIASAALQSTGLGQTAACKPLWFKRCSFLWVRPVCLHVQWRGAISGIVLREQPAFPSSTCRDNEVEMQIRAVGLNFRDVLLVLGEYPSAQMEDPGSDCAAVVSSTGATVHNLKRGDELFGMSAGCLSSFIRARSDARLMAKRPPCISAQAVCTLPSTWCAVHEVTREAKLHGRKSALLHAAAGGVGLVSVEYCGWLRVDMIATAGSSHKHSVLRSLEVNRSCSSRDGPSFAHGIAKQMAALRLDGACNSLIDDFSSAAIATLKEGSTFVEIGKRAAWSLKRFGSATRGSTRLVTLDMASAVADRMSWFHGLLLTLASRLQDKVVSSLPLTSFSINNVHAAFHLLKSGNNIGKVVVFSPFTNLLRVQLRRETAAAVNGGGDGGQASSPVRTAAVSLSEVIEAAERIAETRVDADAPLMEAGIDSLGGVELRNQLQRAVGTALPSTLMFDHPTARELAALFEAQAANAAAAPAQQIRLKPASDGTLPAASLDGLSCVLPGARSLEVFSSLTQCTADCIVEVPLERWDVSTDLPETIAYRARHAGFMQGAELCDNSSFGVSPAEAAAMDPQQRLLLECSYSVLHTARFDRLALSGSLTGMFLGIASNEFGQILAASPIGSSVYAATGSALSVAAGRVSYTLGLNGPCVSYDTACSAALSACHAALRALQLSESTSSVAAGANMMLTPRVALAFAVAGDSPSGLSTFDARADGFTRGEACGAASLNSGESSTSFWCG